MTTTQATSATPKKARQTPAAPAAKPKRTAAAKKPSTRAKKPAAAAKSTFTAAKAATPPAVAGVTADPPAAPKPLTGTAHAIGTIYDAQEWIADRLGLGPKGELRLFHHESQVWPGAVPGEKTWVSTSHSRGLFNTGFYTATEPDTLYGRKEFQLGFPVKAFKGKKVIEVAYGKYRDPMPDGVHIVVVTNPYSSTANQAKWFIFKPGDDAWLNESATTADWDADDEVMGWS
ncbi:MAG: hypothetical protein IPJ65_36930 [Archangiaceae bacterium]|nr:hypothetical protein [Archangiaceae bacterium]